MNESVCVIGNWLLIGLELGPLVGNSQLQTMIGTRESAVELIMGVVLRILDIHL